ncbi:MAG: TetR/AcrR family transcriptional regulator [Acidimicrobiales bacterium]
MSTPAAATQPLTRRARQRQATVAEIKTLARRQLAEAGPGALSLRAIARQMGTASSALYRYFASYDDLISALCIDAYNAVADALAEACEGQPADDPARQWWAICHAYRDWALDNPADFALIFGTPIPGYQAPPDVTGPAAGRFMAVPAAVYATAVATGAADPNRTQVPPTIQTGELLGHLLGDAASFPAQHAALLLNAWASLRGYLMGEIFGSLTQLIDDTDELFDAHVRTTMLGIGFDPTHIDTPDT